MLKLSDENMVWVWACPFTGIVFDNTISATEDYSSRKAINALGKRRAETGRITLCRVTIKPCSEEETAAARAEFEQWKARKDAERAAKESK
jgi:hypothetical protein